MPNWISSRRDFAAAVLLPASLLCASARAAQAQNKPLPDAPATHLFVEIAQNTPPPPASAGQQAAAQMSDSSQTALPSGPRLTLAQAEQLAIKNNPNISMSRLIALAQAQVTREARSIEMPQASGNLTAIGANNNGRLTGDGSMNSPRLLDKASGGLTVSQLITDFGRTHNLVKSAQSNARAQFESERATELDITLTVDQAFYQALTAQAVLKVAQDTVNQRQQTDDQVSALTKSKIRSDLDLSFADVQLAQAKLLLLDAQNREQTAMASLNNVLGSDQDQQYTLVDETKGTPSPAPTDAEAMVQAAFTARPDLAALNDRYLSAKQYATAKRDLWMPTVSAMASSGGAPVRDDIIQSSWYGAAGANISIPVFNGFLFNAETKEAKLRAQAAQEDVRNLRDIIARDVRMAVLNAQTAFQRIAVTQQLLYQANFAFDLASARYKIGLSSIVALSQAQLQQTQAQIDYATARYEYEIAMAEVRFQIGQ
ncbi:MAG: TolC family protein [Terracidiphilus sp.]